MKLCEARIIVGGAQEDGYTLIDQNLRNPRSHGKCEPPIGIVGQHPDRGTAFAQQASGQGIGSEADFLSNLIDALTRFGIDAANAVECI